MDPIPTATFTAPALALDDPRLLPFLPMLYLAWSDGDLGSAEASLIRDSIAATQGIDQDAAARLGRWLDAADPPSVDELGELLAAVRRVGRDLDPSRRRTLSELAEELALASDGALGDEERGALAAIEEALGLSGVEVGRSLLAPARPVPPAVTPLSGIWPIEVDPGAPFSLRALARWLDGAERPTRQRVRQLIAQPELQPPADLTRPERRAWTLAACRRLATEGLGGLSYPREHGGAADPASFVAVFETLAFGDLGLLVKFGVQFGLFGGSIQQLGTDRHHALLPRVATLELPGCFAMTETGHGSNVQELETTATHDPASDELVLHTPSPAARKDFIGNAAADGRLATVFAQLMVGGASQGVHAVLVPIRDAAGAALPGVTIEDCGAKMGLEGVDNGRLTFDRVRVPRANLLDRFAQLDPDGRYGSAIASPNKRFFTMLGTLVGGRVSVGLAALSAAKTALAIAVRYGATRRQFGPTGEAERTLLDYQTHQRRLLPSLATTYALHVALRRLAAGYVDPTARAEPSFEGLAAGLKALATNHATATIQACREACGGMGYLAINRFAALKADSDVFTTFEGDNTVLLQLVAKHLLSGYRRQFGHLDALGLLRYLAEQAQTAITELNPVVTRRTDPAHLRDRAFHRDAFEWRAQHLLATLARRLKARVERGIDPFDALVACQDHAVASARAHLESVALEDFGASVATAPDELRQPLALLCDLYALWHLDLDRGWFLEHGYLEPAKSKAIRKQVDAVCRELRPLAVALVDGFAIPEPCLPPSVRRG